MKKITGPMAEDYYSVYDQETGEIIENARAPEYTTMSRRPGIGAGWIEKYQADVYPDDFVVLRGKKMRPPKFYDRQYELTEPENYESIKRARKKNAAKHEENNTPDRLKVRQKVAEARLKKLPRKLEES